MPGADVPRIGLVTDTDLHRRILQTVLKEQGYQLTLLLSVKNLDAHFKTAPTDEPDAWLIDLVDTDAEPVIEMLVENADSPFLVNDEVPLAHEQSEFDEWQRRLAGKLEVVALRNDSKKNSQRASQKTSAHDCAAETVWVLGASLGGPDAVKRFLTALPKGLPLAMVYAQHIEVNFDKVLADAIGARHSYPVNVVSAQQRLLPGEIAVVPADRQLRFLPFGEVVAIRKPWEGLYQPAIDQVIAGLARIYRDRLGVIIFSGLCNDGEIGCRVAKACGATVWAQTPHSCQSPDMPEAAIATGCVSFQGSPEQLAQALADHYSAKT